MQIKIILWLHWAPHSWVSDKKASKKEAARKKLNKADKKYSKNLQNKTFRAWKKQTLEAKEVAHRRLVEKETEKKIR